MEIFTHPEIKELYRQLLTKLLDESGRGAILIATSHVEDFLVKLLDEVFPKDISKKQKDILLKYPGHLSSFSSKIELAYAFRLISKNLYTSINALRRIRNDAAHSPAEFNLIDLNEKLKEVYNLGEHTPYFIRKISTEMLLETKMVAVKEIIEEWNVSKDEKRQKLLELFEDKETSDELNKQLPFWELIHGICFICAIIVYEKEAISKLTNDITTWGSLSRKK